ncbi:MAG: hypothetical protein AAF660_04955 [Pseudomonadota bacterium]
MLSLFRRHRILTIFTMVALLLILIGWWVRVDVELTPANQSPSTSETASSSG